MPSSTPNPRYRFGVFDMDTTTGELRRKGIRVRLHAQPFQVLALLLEHPGQVLTRDDIARALWPDGTFVDFEHGVNSAINRLREALGDKAANPQFIETLARRGYRFLAPVERLDTPTEPTTTLGAPYLDSEMRETLPNPTRSLETALPNPAPELSSRPESALSADGAERPAVLPATTSSPTTLLATPADLPKTSASTAQTLFLLLQLMYVGFYIGALANLTEIDELLSALSHPGAAFLTLIVTAAILIPVRTFLFCALTFRAPNFQRQYLRLWPWLLLPADILWSLAPFLLLHHMNAGLALACTTFLVYAPFAQRSLILMTTQNPTPPTT